MDGKLTIREWVEADNARIASLHDKMQPGYTFPGDFGPLFFIRRAVVEENGQIVAAATVKLVGEAFLWVDTDQTAYRRAVAVKMLSDECSRVALERGLEEVSAWIPPKIIGCFKKALRRLGWRKSPWRNWTLVLESRPE